MAVSLVPTSQLVTALPDGERVRTPGEAALALARREFGDRKRSLWADYEAGLGEARGPLQEKVNARALERLAENAAKELDAKVGGGTDVAAETALFQTTITDAIRARVELRSTQITEQRELQSDGVINAAVLRAEGIVTAMLGSVNRKPISADVFRVIISSAIQIPSNEILTDEVLGAFSGNREQAVKTLTEKVLVTFKPNAVVEELPVASPASV